mmetsp:Transcript_56046/g.135656  ORF Transcript_56046/g.135656 Transcript_56046/m.135656 type:complete len:245 (-) Transcript_56046:3216-3950(-)
MDRPSQSDRVQLIDILFFQFSLTVRRTLTIDPPSKSTRGVNLDSFIRSRYISVPGPPIVLFLFFHVFFQCVEHRIPRNRRQHRPFQSYRLKRNLPVFAKFTSLEHTPLTIHPTTEVLFVVFTWILSELDTVVRRNISIPVVSVLGFLGNIDFQFFQHLIPRTRSLDSPFQPSSHESLLALFLQRAFAFSGSLIVHPPSQRFSVLRFIHGWNISVPTPVSFLFFCHVLCFLFLSFTSILLQSFKH